MRWLSADACRMPSVSAISRTLSRLAVGLSLAKASMDWTMRATDSPCRLLTASSPR